MSFNVIMSILLLKVKDEYYPNKYFILIRCPLKFTFVTLFPNLIEPYFYDSILKRAVEATFISYEFYDPREYTNNKHKKVDKQMVGGGAGMLMTCQPLFDCLDEIKQKNPDAYIIFPLAAAKPFRQNDAKRLAKKKNIVFVSEDMKELMRE